MQVIVSEHEKIINVIQDTPEEKYQNESVFLHHVKRALIAQGFDVIKKRMWKDGHLVDDTQQYIRMRDCSWCIYNPIYAISGLNTRFMRYGYIIFQMVQLN